MKRKGVFVILLFLFIICGAGAVIGYLESKKETKKPVENEVKGNIKYVYYLDDVEDVEGLLTKKASEEPIDGEPGEVDPNEIPVEPEKLSDKYVFVDYNCTNDFKGEFDIEKWEFVPSSDNPKDKDSTCKLYFNKSMYQVSFTITKGEAKEPVFVKRGEDGIFEIKPNEGHEKNTLTCGNKEATWDEVNNKLIVNAITSDLQCQISFKEKMLTMKVIVVNGTGNTTEEAIYGSKTEAIIGPSIGYENPTVSCTNNQEAKINSNNTMSIDKLTDNTECTVTYEEKKETFTLNVEVPHTIKISVGSSSQTINKGAVGQFGLRPDSGVTIKSISCHKTGATGEIVTPSVQDNQDGSKTYSFIGMDKNITCIVEAGTE